MNQLNKLVAIFLIGSAFGVALTKKFIKPETITKTEIKEVVRTDVQTVEHIVKQKDGSEVIERIVTDHTVQTKDNYIVSATEKKLWNIQLFSGLSLDDKEMIYGISIQKKFIGDISLGILATTSKEIGVSVGYSF